MILTYHIACRDFPEDHTLILTAVITSNLILVNIILKPTFSHNVPKHFKHNGIRTQSRQTGVNQKICLFSEMVVTTLIKFRPSEVLIMPDKTDKTALVTPPPDKNLISMN
jgi:hypothetical protein